MTPRIIENEKIQLVGIRIDTSLSEDKTFDLWNSFMPQVKNIDHRTNDYFYSVQIYPKNIAMEDFTPITTFEKWAAVAVSKIGNLPAHLSTLIIPSGTYAIFKHKGVAADFYRTSQQIFGTWLPNSTFLLADRPHFEIMEANYNGPNDPNSEEDVYIPINPKP